MSVWSTFTDEPLPENSAASDTSSPPLPDENVIRSLSSQTDYSDEEQQQQDVREGRVIVRMEVSHTEHSSLIGPGGSIVREMRSKCQCLIHYPDGNPGSPEPTSRSYPHLHSNEVSVRGKINNAIPGCQRVRDTIPHCFVYDIPGYGRFYEVEFQGPISKIQEIFQVEVTLKTECGFIKQVVIRGAQDYRTLQGVKMVISLFVDSASIIRSSPEVTQEICIHPHSQSAMWNLCNGERWLKDISENTKVSIVFPSPRSEDKQTIVLRGPVDGVAAAWILLMSLLPITVRVFINRDIDFRRDDLERYISHDLQVNFLVPRKERRPEDRQYIELRTFEGNMENLLMAFNTLMTNTVVPKVPITTVADKLRQMRLFSAVPLAAPRYLSGTGSVKTSSHTGTKPHASRQIPLPPFPPSPMWFPEVRESYRGHSHGYPSDYSRYEAANWWATSHLDSYSGRNAPMSHHTGYKGLGSYREPESPHGVRRHCACRHCGCSDGAKKSSKPYGQIWQEIQRDLRQYRMREEDPRIPYGNVQQQDPSDLADLEYQHIMEILELA